MGTITTGVLELSRRPAVYCPYQPRKLDPASFIAPRIITPANYESISGCRTVGDIKSVLFLLFVYNVFKDINEMCFDHGVNREIFCIL